MCHCHKTHLEKKPNKRHLEICIWKFVPELLLRVLPDIGRHADLLHLLLQCRDVIVIVIVVVLTELVLDCPNMQTPTPR
jgi:hypothetical protein